MQKQLFVNLPVKDLNKTKDFFARLGFSFNQKFTNGNAACMVIAENIYAMLIVENYFKEFTTKEITDTMHSTEMLLAVSLSSREEVDDMKNKAVAAGGRIARDPQDYGWMYTQSIEDLDGHTWEFLYMNEAQIPNE